MDNKFTERMEEWLNSEHSSEENIIEGATMMLQLNRNRIMYNTIMRKPSAYVAKIEYELKKNLKIRLDGLTLDDVQHMTEQVVPEARAIINVPDSQVIDEKGETSDVNENEVIKGKRADHDLLPEEIQKKWDDNSALYKKIKKNFYALLQLLDAPSCDRYEILKIQKELDLTYHQNLAAYDAYKIDDDAPISATDDASTVAKKIQAARVFVSRNIKVLSDLKEQLSKLDDSDTNSQDKKSLSDKINEVSKKLSDKYEMLINAGATLAPETLQQLNNLSIISINAED